MKAKTKKNLQNEMESNLKSGCEVLADAAGKAWINTSRGMRCVPKAITSLVTDEQWKKALSKPRIHYADPLDNDQFIR